MILVDASIWIAHLRRADARLSDFLGRGLAASHPHVIGELALGSIPRRRDFLASLAKLPQPPVASHEEVLVLIEAESLSGRGIGYTDAHLLASAKLGAAQLWTADRRLRAVAEELGLAALG